MAALGCVYCLLLSRAALSFRGTVRTMCHPFPLEKSLLVSWQQLVSVQPDTNRFSLCYRGRKHSEGGDKAPLGLRAAGAAYPRSGKD